MSDFIEINGAEGEGGGQVLRSSLTLSILTQKPFIIKNIRANRDQPGLKAQHLTAIEAASYISQASVEGNKPGSREISFIPGKCIPGHYFFNIKTAGAISLVLQTIHLPLALAKEPSTINIKGGTHVPFSPVFEYIKHIWANNMAHIHNKIDCEIENAGFYPKGGGSCKINIQPQENQIIRSIDLTKRLPIKNLSVTAILCKLPEHIASREIETLKKFLRKHSIPAKIQTEIKEYRGLGSANCLFLDCEFNDGFHVGFSEMGKKGRSAEQVAEALGTTFLNYWRTKTVVDEHLADQLLLPLSFASGPSKYSVSNITRHLTTNADIIKSFTDVKINITGEKSGLVEIFPA